MNRFILLSLLPLFCITLQGQNKVVIDGVTFSADRKTLIRYPKDKVDKEYVVPEGTETIGESAFENNIHLKTLDLPLSLKVIEDWAMSNTYLTSIIWHTYPEVMGRNIFAYSEVMVFAVSEDSDDCISMDGVLFSKDKKILLLFPRGKVRWGEYEVPDGTEVIATGAFESGQIDEITLPSSLVRIEDYAFRMTERIPTRGGHRCVSQVLCQALIPPVIVGNPFDTPEYISLSVPEKSFDSYCNTLGWQDFRTINGRYTSVDDISVKATKVWFEDVILNVKSEQPIAKVYVYNQIGTLLTEQEAGGNSWLGDMEALHPQGLLLIRVVYDDFTESVFKLVK